MLVMLDRDGVLIEDRADFVKTPDELVMIPGAAEALARLGEAGHKLALVTNQSAIGRGLFDEAMLARIHARLRDELSRSGAKLDAIFFCPDPPWAATERRKPNPGMLLEAMRQFRTSASDSIMIGDDLRDIEAAARAGCRRTLVRTGKGARTQSRGLPSHLLPVAVHDDLPAAADAILGRKRITGEGEPTPGDGR